MREILERVLAKPVHFAKGELPHAERLAGAHHHLAARGIELQHIERLARGDANALTLADRVVDDPAMAAEHAPVDMHDVAGLSGVEEGFVEGEVFGWRR